MLLRGDLGVFVLGNGRRRFRNVARSEGREEDRGNGGSAQNLDFHTVRSPFDRVKCFANELLSLNIPKFILTLSNEILLE